jgi:hypothetical protein
VVVGTSIYLNPVVVVISLYLDPVVIGVRHDDLFLHSQTEPVRRVELSLSRAQGPEFATDLHRIQLKHGIQLEERI